MVLRPENGLSLCAGGGGLDMGLQLAEPGFHTRCYVEWEEYPRQSIIAAQRAGYFSPAPIWDDVCTFDGIPWRGHIDTILAGYPCQPFSQAGQRKGEDDERHLWPEVARIIREVQPRWVFLENVAGHVSLGAETVLRELWDMGWTPATGLFSAQETGAPHERLRWFCVAYGGHPKRRESSSTRNVGNRDHSGWPQGDGGAGKCGATVADADGGNPGAERQQRSGEQRFQQEGRGDGGSGVGNASIDGRNEGRSEHGVRSRRNSTASASGELDHPTSPRCNDAGQRSGADQQGGECLPGAGRGELADAGQSGSQGREQPGSPEQRNGQVAHGPVAECRGIPLFPPGPNETEAWGAVIRSAPDMAPAASARDLFDFARASELPGRVETDGGKRQEAPFEPRVRRMAHGVAVRSFALRLLGNGVCPLAAGHAWRSLAVAHGLRPVDLEAACGNEIGGSTGTLVRMEE